ncbi:hypothetical protein BCR33DRAFT_583371 [Rhizoclosmatium globosum]|uniref:Transcription factor domain-containing protein n=1 Tax=Rhizoclosmatium globosum TaxID=329046 RepID=A0A1Y2CR90_9FUNG|nr:hypothetical protein BCR33DRAFT_583371 [Rhizoclosmatium globosum]|eukprot:ORY49466.1 hypothetical protein BCR33DRAFT_583371 [Rhizoclosmatium globosum]
MKKTELGLPFLRMAVDMVNALQMDIDPDDLAFPLGFDLSETEKEERRRFVWALSLLVDLEMSLSLKSGLPELSLKHIKPLTPIPGLLHTYRSYEPCIQTKHFLVAVKKHYSNVPHSIQDIFHSNSFKTLHSNIPLHNLINIEPQMFQSYDAVTMRYLIISISFGRIRSSLARPVHPRYDSNCHFIMSRFSSENVILGENSSPIRSKGARPDIDIYFFVVSCV